MEHGSQPPRRRSQTPDPLQARPEATRSVSPSSSGSVATISTNRSVSPGQRERNEKRESSRRDRSRSVSSTPLSPPRKRQRSPSVSSDSQSPPRFRGTAKARRYRSNSPDGRGRSNEIRRSSQRSRSRSRSMNRSEITKHRRSIDAEPAGDETARVGPPSDKRTFQNGRPAGRSAFNEGGTNRRKERSLSPYSRRLALTQAMNRGR